MSEAVTTEAGELLLDPFSYHPGLASAVDGLGGTERSGELGYVLHTQYVRVAEGPANFILRFQGLTARLGTLQLRVHMFVEGPAPRFLLANTVRIQMNRLIQLGSELAVRFEGIKGVQFAIHGAMLGETDARAAGLEIALDRPAPDEEEVHAQSAADLRNTEYGRSAASPVPLLLSTAPPTLAGPVCQAATVAQLLEPQVAQWAAQLGLERASDRTRWAVAYVMQALRTYGMLQDGARGLGFGAEAEAIRRAVAESGCAGEVGSLPDFPERLPAGMTDFDFLWSIDATARGGAEEVFGWVDGLARCLRPGGLAVHVVPFLPSRDQRGDEPSPMLFRRAEVERMALTMISRGLETAQIKIDWAEPVIGEAPGLAEAGAFGFLLRRAPMTEH